MDLDAAEAAITPRTRAIMPVHLARPPGRPRPRSARCATPRPHRHRGRRARDGHAVARPADRHARQPRRVLVLRDEERHDGRGRRARDRQPVHRARGRAARAPRPEPRRLAALRRRRLPPLRGRLARPQGEHDRPRRPRSASTSCRGSRRGRRAARELAARYDALLADLPLETPAAGRPARAALAGTCTPCSSRPRPASAATRSLDGLLSRRIGTGVHYRGVHLHPYYATTYGIAPEDLPVASDISDRTLSLPLGPALTESDQDDVVEALAAVLTGGPALVRERAGHDGHEKPARRDAPRRDRPAACAGRRSCASGRRSSRSRRWSSSPT